MHRDLDGLCECHDCGLLQRLPEGSQGSLLLCVRCRAVLRQVRRASVLLACSCAGAGLALLVLSLAFPVASVATQIGGFSTSDVFTGPVLAKETGAPVLALAVVATLLVLPLIRFAAVLIMGLCLRVGRVPTWVRWLFAVIPFLAVWSMVDVFLLGALIALTRLQRWAHVSFGPALFALTGVAVCSLAMDAALDRWAFWRGVPLRQRKASAPSDVPVGCHHCGTVSRVQHGYPCPRCERKLEPRSPNSRARSWALGSAAALLLVPANVLPVMTVTKLGGGGPSTIMGGTIELAEHGLWGLAFIVFVASVVVPALKLVGLFALLVMCGRGRLPVRVQTRVYRAVHTIGRWSMVDIFATVTLVALARFGWFGHVLPGAGATAFCAVVLLTMWAADSFDPRLLWDCAGYNAERRVGRTWEGGRP